MKGVILVEWSRKQRKFVVNSEEAIADEFPTTELSYGQSNVHPQEDNQAIDLELNDLITRFEDCSNLDASSALAEMQPIRTQILTTILSNRAPLRWLPAFLQTWQDLLDSLDENKLTPIDCVEYCQELMALASGWKIIGDITHARSTLGQCFQVVRCNLRAPFADPEPFKGHESRALQATAIAAKKLLLECVAFQTSVARSKTLFERQAAPAVVQASLSNEFWQLLREAPLSVEIAYFLAQNLMKQRQFALVIRVFNHSPFYGEDAALTLIHARALEYGGFYRQAIAISESFTQRAKEVNTIATEALQSHCDQLKKLLANREKADENLRLEKYMEAAKGYEKCLTLVDPADYKQLSALLFGHANALLEQGHLSEAINELCKSVQLNPANKIASVRLQTVRLQVETQRIKSELSQNKTGKKVRKAV